MYEVRPGRGGVVSAKAKRPSVIITPAPGSGPYDPFYIVRFTRKVGLFNGQMLLDELGFRLAPPKYLNKLVRTKGKCPPMVYGWTECLSNSVTSVVLPFITADDDEWDLNKERLDRRFYFERNDHYIAIPLASKETEKPTSPKRLK